jgi:peptide/nickel transport system substrate-binding protein
MRKLAGLLAGAAILAAACGGTSTTPAPASVAPASVAPASAAPSEAVASASASAAPAAAPDLFGTTYKPAAPVKTGGTLLVGDWQEATQFNPYYYGQVSEANVSTLVFNSLVTFSNDFKYYAQLAAEIPTVDNGGVTLGQNGDAMTVTWKIRPGLKWSDGQPLGCKDFVFTKDWVVSPDNVGVVTTGFTDMSKIDCASDTDMVVHYKAVFEGYIAQWGAVLPEHYFKDFAVKDMVSGAGFRSTEVTKVPVSGPFKFESVTPGAELTLARNENYSSVSTGKPASLDAIKFKWYGDVDSMIAGFRAGEVDVAIDLQESDIPKVQDLGTQVSAVPALTYEFLRPNWSTAEMLDTTKGIGGCSKNAAVADRGPGCPMADPAMREALAYAIDKNEINTRLLGGQMQVANTGITPSAWFYADQPPATYDPAKAQQILDEAGWKDTNGDGIREKNGLTAKVELCTTTRQVRQDTLALVSAWLKAVGIDSIINPVSSSDIFADYNEGTVDTPCILARQNFDIAEHAYSSSIDPLGNYTTYHSSQYNPVGGNNAMVNDPDIDKSMTAVKDNVDFTVIRDAMATFQKLYVDKTVEVPLYYRKTVELYSPKLQNVAPNGAGGYFWNGEDWFLTD